MKDKKQEREKGVIAPHDMVVYNPENPLYSRQHLCIYLRELYDLAEAEAISKPHNAEGDNEKEEKEDKS
ncbi:MAG TPA: hypothetical protein PK864_05240 [Syntrophorhabdaceae bacterium]|nr:hypothetical protein [Syntrophorhabdaceae bacterium]HPP42412.1 hypothetical protein [Syntrophorhabdaceae bacterium]HRR71925.1 hypothetical protein [Syntrophorhabdaceae bacterium]